MSYKKEEVYAEDPLPIDGTGILGPASITEVASGTGDAQGVSGATGLRLLGFSVRESAGTPATAEIILRHGTDATGTPIAFVNVQANGNGDDHESQWFGPEGIDVPNGVFVDRISGETHIVLFTKTVASS